MRRIDKLCFLSLVFSLIILGLLVMTNNLILTIIGVILMIGVVIISHILIATADEMECLLHIIKCIDMDKDLPNAVSIEQIRNYINQVTDFERKVYKFEYKSEITDILGGK